MWWGQGDELLDAEYFAETFQTVASGLGPGTDNTCIPAPVSQPDGCSRAVAGVAPQLGDRSTCVPVLSP